MDQVARPLDQIAQLSEVHRRQVHIDETETLDEVLPGVDLCDLGRVEEALWQRDERVVADVDPLQLRE